MCTPSKTLFDCECGLREDPYLSTSVDTQHAKFEYKCYIEEAPIEYQYGYTAYSYLSINVDTARPYLSINVDTQHISQSVY